MNVIDHKKIKLPVNYCLILPDEELEKYHLNGKETDIYVGRSLMKYIDEHDSLDFEMKETVDTYAHHWPISGRVIAVPDKLVFNGHKLVRRRESISDESMTPDDMKELNQMSQHSLRAESPLEIEVGDTVFFDYLKNLNCYDDGMYLNTDIGTMFLLRYDDLIGKKNSDGIMPLNGNIFFEWDQQLANGGIVLQEKQIYDAVGPQQGIVTHVGTPISYYLQGAQLVNQVSDFEVGDRIYFLPQLCTMIESQMHLHIFDGKEIYTALRYDILARVPKE